ncbi:SDR family oxidoreductase [Candidatus Neomarinimicrobiota bacterium]
MSNANKTVAVFGGTGHYGSGIVRSLLARGAGVQVLTRNPQGAREGLGEGAELITGDIMSREAVRSTLEGAQAVMLSVSALHWKSAKRLQEIERDGVLQVVEEAQRAGITRVVYTSGYELRENFLKQHRMEAFGAIKLEVEGTLAASDLNWTILGCAPSMDLFFAFVRKGRMTVPGGGPPTGLPTIARRDVGEIAAQALLRDDLGGRRFRLTGPEALSFPEAARRIGELTGQPLKVIRIPLLPFRVGALLTRPFNPFVQQLYWSIKLMNNFPPDLAARVPTDHALLRETFEYKPVTFEMEARKRYQTTAAE